VATLGPDALWRMRILRRRNRIPGDGDEQSAPDVPVVCGHRVFAPPDGEDGYPDAFEGPRTVEAGWRIGCAAPRSIAQDQRRAFAECQPWCESSTRPITSQSRTVKGGRLFRVKARSVVHGLRRWRASTSGTTAVEVIVTPDGSSIDHRA